MEDNMGEAWMITAPGNRLGHNFLLAQVALGNMLDADTRRFREFCRDLADLIPSAAANFE